MGTGFALSLAVGISLIVGSGLRLVCVQPGKLTHQQALAVTGLSWIVLAFVASVPLALSGHYGSYLDSLMEAVSGLTTTGVTLVIDLEHLSTADNMWRFVMHLIGGLGLIVVALSLGLLGKATSGLYSSEGRSEHVLPNIVNTVRLISRISLTAIAVAVVILFVCAFFPVWNRCAPSSIPYGYPSRVLSPVALLLPASPLGTTIRLRWKSFVWCLCFWAPLTFRCT